jgi:hypothetical protein
MVEDTHLRINLTVDNVLMNFMISDVTFKKLKHFEISKERENILQYLKEVYNTNSIIIISYKRNKHN